MNFGPEQVTLKFRFQVQAPGANDPDFQLPAGAVSDVVRSATGTYAITLKQGERWPAFLGLNGTVMTASGVGLGAIVQAAVADYVPSTGVLTVRVVDPYTDTTPAPIDPADNDWVYVEATFIRRTSMSSAGPV